MLIKRLTSATSKESTKRQVERKRAFEMAMPARGTDDIEHAFDNAQYVRDVLLAFKEGDLVDTLYAMRGLLLLKLQFRNGTRSGEFRNLTVSACMRARTHTHTPRHTTHTPNFTEFVSYFVSVCTGEGAKEASKGNDWQCHRGAG